MRIFAVSDVHIDYDANARWIADLSAADFQQDVLILAGDVTDSLARLDWCLGLLARRFRKVLFVPGNHELWVIRDHPTMDSLRKFEEIGAMVASSGASMEPFRERGVSIIPLLTWYDYSFGEPSAELRACWMDYRACRWPAGYAEKEIAAYFSALNDAHVGAEGDKVITYSHFLPRIDVMPGGVPSSGRMLYPVLGSAGLERHVRRLHASMHVYGHSHVNRRVEIDGVTYINNAFGYPGETRIAAKRLTCIHEF